MRTHAIPAQSRITSKTILYVLLGAVAVTIAGYIVYGAMPAQTATIQPVYAQPANAAQAFEQAINRQPLAPVPTVAVVAPAMPQESVETMLHTVAEGDTLFSIAQRYGKDLGRLREMNNLTNDTIYPGQQLAVGNIGVITDNTRIINGVRCDRMLDVNLYAGHPSEHDVATWSRMDNSQRTEVFNACRT